jgi:hypothetical protein
LDFILSAIKKKAVVETKKKWFFIH